MVAVWLISSQAWFLAKTAILRWLALLFAVGAPLRQSLDCGESGNIDFAAKLSDAADQAFFGYAVAAVVPTFFGALRFPFAARPIAVDHRLLAIGR